MTALDQLRLAVEHAIDTAATPEAGMEFINDYMAGVGGLSLGFPESDAQADSQGGAA